MTEDSSQTPPGRYPSNPTTEGYWDGTTWTGLTRDRVVPAKRPTSGALFATARVLSLVAAVLLVVALGPWPYEYYTALRWIATAAGIVLAVAASRTRQTGWIIAGIATAIAFNPIIPIWLNRGVWTVLDLAFAGLLVVAGLRLRR